MGRLSAQEHLDTQKGPKTAEAPPRFDEPIVLAYRVSIAHEKLFGVPYADLDAMLGVIDKAITSNKTFVIATHADPDPDALGAALGMKKLVEAMSNGRVSPLIVYEGSPSASVAAFGTTGESLSTMKDLDPEKTFLMLLDAPNMRDRNVCRDLDPSSVMRPSMIIDHHRPNGDAAHPFMYPEGVGSTSGVVLALMQLHFATMRQEMPSTRDWTVALTLMCGGVATDKQIKPGIDHPDLRVTPAASQAYKFLLYRSDRELLKTLDVQENIPAFRESARVVAEHLSRQMVSGLKVSVSYAGEFESMSDHRPVIAAHANEEIKNGADLAVVFGTIGGYLVVSLRSTGTVNPGKLAEFVFNPKFAGGGADGGGAQVPLDLLDHIVPGAEALGGAGVRAVFDEVRRQVRHMVTGMPEMSRPRPGTKDDSGPGTDLAF